MSSFLVRAFVAGIVFAVTLAAVFAAIFELATPLPEGLGVAIILGIPVFVSACAASIAAASFASMLVLPKSLQANRWYILGFGTVLAIAAIAAAGYSFPQLAAVGGIAVGSILSGLFFLVLVFLVAKPHSNLIKVVAPIALIVVCGVIIASQQSQGRIRAQVNGLKAVGYDIYIPDASVLTVGAHRPDYIKPYDDRYYSYDRGVNVSLSVTGDRTARSSLYETKANGKLPDSDCRNGYTHYVGSAYDESADSLKYACSLVSDGPDVRIYLREGVHPEESSTYERVNQTYFAIAGRTAIWTSYYDDFVRDSITKQTVEREFNVDSNESEVGRKILEHLTVVAPEEFSGLVVQ